MKDISNEFLIGNKTKKFVTSLNDLLENMPRKDFNLKERISKTTYDLLESIFGANENLNNFVIYERYVTDIKANLMLLDYFLESIYNKKYITEQQLNKFILLLSEITKMVSSWYNNRRAKCSKK